jgi:hypothetical protein
VHMHEPWDGINVVCGLLPSWPQKTCFPFSECQNGFFWEVGKGVAN